MNVRIKGEGSVENNNGAIEYPKNPMEDMIDDAEEGSVDAPDGESLLSKLSEAVEVNDEATDAAGDSVSEAAEVIDAREAPIEELLPESDKEGFDDTQQQDARYDAEKEGGVTKPKTTGPMKLPGGDSAMEGGQVKQREPLEDSTADAYEMSGFHVEIPTGVGMVSQQVTQDFSDVETAKACVNGDTYLMPIQGGVKACKITRGAPIICFNERQILEYVGGVWRKP